MQHQKDRGDLFVEAAHFIDKEGDASKIQCLPITMNDQINIKVSRCSLTHGNANN